jgi:hypothetical protein
MLQPWISHKVHGERGYVGVRDKVNVRKSATLRAMEASKVKEERKVDVFGFSPGCTERNCARTRGERFVSVRVYLGTATLSDRLN